MYRHLIVLIDGTWLAAQNVSANSFQSNIHRLNLELCPTDAEGNPQIVFYTRGIGSTGRLSKYRAGGFASGIDDIISDLYITLCSNYSENDKIYLFGFSRGAVIARALIGMICRIGSLKADSINLYDKVWNGFTNEASPAAIRAVKINSIESFNIEFVGLFDCVFGGNHKKSSRFRRLRFNDLNIEGNVKHVTHIMAMDERRSMFLNMPVQKSISSVREPYAEMEQIWMPGAHSDVGGAYERRFLGDVSLLTMLDRVLQKTSLSLYDNRIQKKYDALIDRFAGGEIFLHNEARGFWSLLDACTRRNGCRFYSSKHDGQYLHPVCKLIADRLVYNTFASKASEYMIPPSFQTLEYFGNLQRFRFDEDEFFYF